MRASSWRHCSLHDAVVFVARPEGTEKVGLEVLFAQLPLASHDIVTAVAIDTGGTASVACVWRARQADKPIVVAAVRVGADGRRRLALAGVASTPVLVEERRTSSIRLATSAGLANTAARWPPCSFLVRSRGCPDGVDHHTERCHT